MCEISENSYTREKLICDLKAGISPLEGARRKWTAILQGGEDFGSFTCACCEAYFNPDDPKSCLSACPLGGPLGCCQGQYATWVRHQNEQHIHDHVFYAIHCPECRQIASNIMTLIKEGLGEGQLVNVAIMQERQFSTIDDKPGAIWRA